MLPTLPCHQIQALVQSLQGPATQVGTSTSTSNAGQGSAGTSDSTSSAAHGQLPPPSAGGAAAAAATAATAPDDVLEVGPEDLEQWNKVRGMV